MIKKKIVLADDSLLIRTALKDVLEKTGQIEVIGTAKNGKEAIEIIEKEQPDVLILDCEMPVMNGLETLRYIMEHCPMPVFMFSSLTWEGASVTIKALEYGALDFLNKPSSKSADGLEKISDQLLRKINSTILRGRHRFAGAQKKVQKEQNTFNYSRLESRKIDLIAMGSSTGGVAAAMKLIPKLAAKTAPIVWVQHMPEKFTKSFADRLNKLSKMHVKEAEHLEVIKVGVCYLAPGGQQMKLVKSSQGLQLDIGGTQKVSGHCPSADYLFDSVSQIFGHNCLGVILTGMGEDGAIGLKNMHNRGAYVLGESEESCVVYGMPRAAFKAGAVDHEMRVEDMPSAITRIGSFG